MDTIVEDDEDDQHHHHREIHNLIQSLRWAHACLDGQAANVLPALLQEGDEVVDGQHDVADELVLSHADVSDRNTQAQNLLQLELDGGLDLGDLAGKVFVVGDGGGELARLGETGTQETGNLLDQSFRGHEGVVLASELLDQLLVLVQFLQIVRGHGVDAVVLRTVDIVLVTEDAAREVSVSAICGCDYLIMKLPRASGAKYNNILSRLHDWTCGE
jgi:hypothetical protein